MSEARTGRRLFSGYGQLLVLGGVGDDARAIARIVTQDRAIDLPGRVAVTGGQLDLELPTVFRDIRARAVDLVETGRDGVMCRSTDGGYAPDGDVGESGRKLRLEPVHLDERSSLHFVTQTTHHLAVAIADERVVVGFLPATFRPPVLMEVVLFIIDASRGIDCNKDPPVHVILLILQVGRAAVWYGIVRPWVTLLGLFRIRRGVRLLAPC